jgi:hypothetical protein
MTSPRLVFGAFVAALAIFVVTHMSPLPGGLPELTSAAGGQSILDQRPAFSSDAVYERLDAFGENGRRLYRRFTITTDVVFPLGLGTFLFLLARFAVDRATPRRVLGTLLPALPILWFACDMTENLTIFSLLSRYPERREFLASYLGFVTRTKQALLVTSFALPALVLRAAVRRPPTSA